MRPLVLLSGLAPGGAERVTVTFLRRLAEEGRAVPVCTLTTRRDAAPAADLSAAGVERHDLGARRLADPVAFGKLLRLVRRGGFDLLHAHGQDASIVAAGAHRLLPFRLVVSRHVLEEPSATRRQRARAALALAGLRRADAVVAVSGAAAERLRELTPIPSRRVHVIPNGLDLEAFDRGARPEEAPALRRSLEGGSAERLVLVPAVLRPGKGHEVLLEAVPGILRAAPDTRFLVAGDGEMRSQLEGRAAHLGDRVVFLGHREDMPALMRAVDLVVLPSRSEALPTVALEAAAAGRALVATRVGGVPEAVAHGRTGLLVPAGDAGALAGAVATLLTDPVRRARLGGAARRRALAEFGVDRQVSDTLALWHAVAGGGVA